MIKRKCHILGYFLVIMLLTGCWDNISIEERGFVVGTALDKKDEKGDGSYLLTMTNQFVVPPGVSTNGAGIEQSAFVNLEGSGDSIFAIDTDMASLTSKAPFFGHLQLLVISEDLMLTPNLFLNALDLFVRDKQMRRGINVIVSEGEAKDVLDIQPENEKIPAIYIDNMLEDSLRETSLFKPVYVGDIHEYLLTNNSFTIPKIIAAENKAEYGGAVVYHGFKNRIVGSLTKEEMIGLNLVSSKDMHGGILELNFEGVPITFKIYNTKGKVEINATDPDQLKINVEVGVEGGIAEVFGMKNLNSPENLEEIEKIASKKVEKLVNKVIEKAQGEFNAEIFGFDDKMRERHYRTWEKIKNDWDQGENYFSKSDIEVTGKVRIRTAGAIDKAKSDEEE